MTYSSLQHRDTNNLHIVLRLLLKCAHILNLMYDVQSLRGSSEDSVAVVKPGRFLRSDEEL